MWLGKWSKASAGQGKRSIIVRVAVGRPSMWLIMFSHFRGISQVFVFGPDKKIWELDKGSATAGDVLGRSYMQRFYEGAVLHDRRRKGPSGARGQDSAWVNGREVRECRWKCEN